MKSLYETTLRSEYRRAGMESRMIYTYEEINNVYKYVLGFFNVSEKKSLLRTKLHSFE